MKPNPSKIKLNFSKKFLKNYAKLPFREQKMVDRALELFQKSPTATKLRPHNLKGEFTGISSITAAHDLRIHCEPVDENTVRLLAVDTHSQLYRWSSASCVKQRVYV